MDLTVRSFSTLSDICSQPLRQRKIRSQLSDEPEIQPADVITHEVCDLQMLRDTPTVSITVSSAQAQMIEVRLAANWEGAEMTRHIINCSYIVLHMSRVQLIHYLTHPQEMGEARWRIFRGWATSG